jgi:hypothetical protein
LDARSPQDTRIVWAFWVASGLIAVGGVVPLLLGGASGRVSWVIVPYWIAAIALGACALLHHRGRATPTLLYSIAGLAVVYGMLAMLAVPLRLAVIGTCPPGPVRCPAGLLPPLTEGENTGLGFAIGMGIVGIMVGFFGLVVVFRRLSRANPKSAAAAFTPPVRRIPPVRTSQASPAEAADAQPEAATRAEEATKAEEPPATDAGAESAPEPVAELPAPEEEPELPAHVEEEAPELPPAGPN